MNKWLYNLPDGDLGIEYADDGMWRSYEILNAFGNNREEFLTNLIITEIGQDGDELDCYGYSDAPSDVIETINHYLAKKDAESK